MLKITPLVGDVLQRIPASSSGRPTGREHKLEAEPERTFISPLSGAFVNHTSCVSQRKADGA